jgi:hypothetical protein
MDSVNPYDAANPVTTTLENIGAQWWFKGWRNYYHVDQATNSQGKFKTDWLTLEAGKYYKLRGQNRDTGGGMFSTVSVEFEKPGSENHPMAAKAVHNWRIDQTNVPETWMLTIEKPSTGSFKLGLKSPKETTTWVSDSITCNVNASTLRSRLYGFFARSQTVDSDISVTRVMYDSAGAET